MDTLSELGKKIPANVVNATVGVAFAAGCWLYPPLGVIGAGGFLAKTVVDNMRNNNNNNNDEVGTNQDQATENPGFTENLKEGLVNMVTPGNTPLPEIKEKTKEAEKTEKVQTARKLIY